MSTENNISLNNRVYAFQMQLPFDVPFTPVSEHFVLADTLENGENSFNTFAYYYQTIQKNMRKNDQGEFVDIYGNYVRSLKMDIFGNIQSLFLVAPYGDSKLILQGEPGKHFEVQGNFNSNLYRYVFENGQIALSRRFDENGISRKEYKNGILVSEYSVRHGHIFSEKKWSEDGKTLLRKKESFMDEKLIEHVSTEFVDKKGDRYTREDLRKDGRLLRSTMFKNRSPDSKQLLWSCEHTLDGHTYFYNSQGMLTRTVYPNARGKRILQ